MILNIPPSVVRHQEREYVELALIMTNVGFSVLGGVDLALEVVGDVDDATFRYSLLVHSRDWPDGMIGSWAPGIPPISLITDWQPLLHLLYARNVLYYTLAWNKLRR